MFARAFTSSSLLVSLLLLSNGAAAQSPEEKAGARAAAENGGAAFEAGRYEEAIDYFSRAEQIIPALPHLLYMARANEKLGRLVQARELYLKIDQEEVPPGAKQLVKDTKKIAAGELEALEPRMPFVSVVVQGAGPEPVTVVRDGSEMPRALVGIPQPMNPGEHTFQAQAPGMASSLQKVTVKEGAKETVLLTLSATTDGGTPAASGGYTGSGATAPDDGVRDTSGPNWMKIGGYSGIGLGVGGLAVGTIFVVMAADTRSQSTAVFEACDPQPGGCSREERDSIVALDDEATSQVTVGVIGLSAGALLAGTGIALLLLDDSDDKPTEASIRAWFGFGSAGVNGRF